MGSTTIMPAPQQPRDLSGRGRLSGDPDCPSCKGVGQVNVTPESQGWVKLDDGSWLVKTGGIHRFSAGEYLMRPCACVNVEEG